MTLVLIGCCIGLVAGLTAGHIYSKKNTHTVKFVSSTEKQSIISKNNIKFSEETVCSVCGQRVTIDNVGAILQTESGNTYVCSKNSCLTLSNIVS